jgi:hypothetical protein
MIVTFFYSGHSGTQVHESLKYSNSFTSFYAIQQVSPIYFEVLDLMSPQK